MCRSLVLRLCLVIIPTSIFLASCVFNSDEEYFKTVPQPNPTAVEGVVSTIDLTNYSPEDTITIFGSTDFFFSLNGVHGDIKSAYVYLDGEVIAEPDVTYFHLGLFDLRTGVSKLKLDVTINSGTGSLADAVGSEKLDLSFEWFVRIDLTAPPKPLPTVDIVNGFLTINWSAYSKPNFKSYLVTRKRLDERTKTFEIKHSDTTTWVDATYVGGTKSPVQYSVSIVTEVGTATSDVISRTDTVDFDFSFDPSDSTFVLNWTPTKFFGAFKQYRVAIGDFQHLHLETDINTSTYTGKLSSIRFGGDSFVGINFQSKSEDFPEYWNWSSACTIGTPLPFTPVGQIKFNTYLNNLVAVNADGELVKLNDQLEPVETIATLKGTSYRMPYPGNYIYTTSNDRTNNNIYRTNIDDQAEVAYDYFYLSYPNSNTVASSGLICIDYDRPPVTSANIPPLYITAAFEPPNGSNVFGENSNTVKLSAVISEDGKFIWANDNRVFKISGGTSELIGSFSGPGKFIGFRPDKSNEMMFEDAKTIKFYDANTFALIRSIPPPIDVFWDPLLYDIGSKNMFWRDVGSSTDTHIVNIETGIVKDFAISFDISPADLYYLNGLLIYRGKYIKVQ